MDIEGPLAILCADVGSVAKRNFGWAGVLVGSGHQDLGSGSDIVRLAETVADDLNNKVPVALGFECPLFVPIPQDPARLTPPARTKGKDLGPPAPEAVPWPPD